MKQFLPRSFPFPDLAILICDQYRASRMVGRSLGAAAAGQFNIYIQLTQMVHFVPSSLFAFSLPAFSRLAAQGGEGARQIAPAYRTYLGVTSATALALALQGSRAGPILSDEGGCAYTVFPSHSAQAARTAPGTDRVRRDRCGSQHAGRYLMA